MIQIDMEMPQNCKFCPLHDVNPDQCPIRTIYKDDYATSRFTDCPLYKIAEDTDTISRKEAIDSICRTVCDNPEICESPCYEVKTLINIPSAQPYIHPDGTLIINVLDLNNVHRVLVSSGKRCKVFYLDE